MRCIVTLSLLVIACGPTSGNETGGGGGGGGGLNPADAGPWSDARDWGDEFADAAPQQACDKMDIVFVVDNSGSMAQEQDNLAVNFPRFIEVLQNFDTDLDYRVGVTTTGVDFVWNISLPPLPPVPGVQTGGDNGALLQRCDMTRPWVDETDADPSATFACAALVGDDGPGQEMPLAAVMQAFTDRLDDGSNAGFHREDALLAFVILTDEDDCSYATSPTLGFAEIMCQAQITPVSAYVDFLNTLTGGAGRWAVSVIAGPGPGSCESEFGSAAEASRLQEFVSLAGANGVFSSICNGDLAVGLEDALNTFDTACESFPDID